MNIKTNLLFFEKRWQSVSGKWRVNRIVSINWVPQVLFKRKLNIIEKATLSCNCKFNRRQITLSSSFEHVIDSNMFRFLLSSSWRGATTSCKVIKIGRYGNMKLDLINNDTLQKVHVNSVLFRTWPDSKQWTWYTRGQDLQRITCPGLWHSKQYQSWLTFTSISESSWKIK